jgi:glycosyltransferase involved in cell wall biosynthesis
MYFNTVSNRQIEDAPEELHKKLLGAIYNGIDVEDYDFRDKKQDFYLSVGSIKKDKGQGAAARLCQEAGAKLKIAGIVAGGINDLKTLLKEKDDLTSDYKGNNDFKYFISDILPYLSPGEIEYIGVVSGNQKLRMFGEAKALLSPIEWEEPFGIVIIEALASGTPVVTYRKGAMPEIIEHGVNGFLANNEKEFKQYMLRVGDIDPQACRDSVIRKFSYLIMAKEYEKRYRQIIAKGNNRSFFSEYAKRIVLNKRLRNT